MKLIKLSSDHYIIVDENRDIHENDYTFKNGEIREVSFLMQDNGCVITHSTQLDKGMDNVTFIYLSEVKELLGDVDVNKIGYNESFRRDVLYNDKSTIGEQNAFIDGVKYGYNQALEDNKGKVYTKEDMIQAYRKGEKVRYSNVGEAILEKEFIQSIQPPTSWDVEFVDGKLKLV